MFSLAVSFDLGPTLFLPADDLINVDDDGDQQAANTTDTNPSEFVHFAVFLPLISHFVLLV